MTTTTTTDDLGARVTRLADEHRVVEALLAFADARDRHDLAAALECCTDDIKVIVDGPAAERFGGADGIDELAQLWAGDSDRVPFLMQFHSEVEVSLHDDRALVSAKVIAPATLSGPEGDDGVWLSARLLAEVVRTADGWAIAMLRYEPIMATPYAEGWGVRRFVS